MKKAVVCVSFGTSVPAGRENITAVENVLRQAAQDRMFISAFTSPTIRRILRERGETVYSPAEALEALRSRGVTEVLLQPTHILRGHEYDKLKREAAPWREKFDTLRVGDPLLTDTEDLRTLAAGLSAASPQQNGETLVLFGHSTDHAAELVNPALQTAFRLAGRTDVLGEQGLALAVATHDVDFAWRWARRILVFRDGCLAADRTPEEIFSDTALLDTCHLARPMLFRAAGAMGLRPRPRTMEEFERAVSGRQGGETV